MGEVKVFTRSRASTGFPNIEGIEDHPLSSLMEDAPLDGLRTPNSSRDFFQGSTRIGDDQLSPKILSYINSQSLDTPRLPRITAYLPAESAVSRTTQEKIVDYAQAFFLKNIPSKRLEEMRGSLVALNVPEAILRNWERNVGLIGDVVKARLSKESTEDGTRTVTHHIILPLLYSVDDSASVQRSW